MAEVTEEAILNIKVEWGEAADKIVRYRKEVNELNDRIKKLYEEQAKLDTKTEEGAKTFDEMGKEILRLTAREKERLDQIRALNKEMQNEVRSSEVYDDSLKSLRAQLSNLTKAYDELSRTQRQGKDGEKLAKEINRVTNELKKAEEGTQRYYRSVGSYKQSIMDALGANNKWVAGLRTMNDVIQGSGGVKGAMMAGAQAVKAFGAELLALLAHPVVAILAAIAAAIMLVVKGIQSSEENSMKLRIVLEPLNRALTWQLKIIQDLTAVILDWAYAAEKAILGMSRMAESLPVIGRYIKQFNDMMEQGIKRSEEENQLVLDERKNAIENEQITMKIAKLRKEAQEKDKRTLQERKRLLEDAIALEEHQLDINLSLAQRKYDIIKQRSDEGHNDEETNQKLAEAEMNLYRVQTAYYTGVMKLQKQKAKVDKELDAEEDKAEKKAIKRNQELTKQRESTLREIRKYEDIMLSLITDNAEQQRKKLQIAHEREIADLEAKMAKEKYLTKTILAEIAALKQKYIIDSAKLELQLTQNTIQQEQKRIQILLQGAKKETQEEYNLKLAQFEQQKALDLLQIEQAQYTEEQKGELRLAIAQKYAQQYDELEKNRINTETKKQEEALRIMFETAIAKAGEDALEVSRLQMEMAQKQSEQLQQYQGETLEAFNLRKAQADQAYIKSKQNYNAKEVEIEQAKFTAMKDITDGLVSLTEELGASDESFAKASKVLALATIAIQTGQAIAKMVSAEAGKGVAGLATMAGGIATILTNIATALKTVRSAQFSRGGLIDGAGTQTSDSNTIRVSDGESVINARSTAMFAPLLSQLNQLGGGVPIEVVTGNTNTIGEDMLATAFAKGAMMLPSPVVSVEEINSVANRVQVLENLSKI